MTVFEGVEVRVQLVKFERIASSENGDKFSFFLLGVVVVGDSAGDAIDVLTGDSAGDIASDLTFIMRFSGSIPKVLKSTFIAVFIAGSGGSS